MGVRMLVERFLSWMMSADERQRGDAAQLLARLHGDPRLSELDREAVEAGLTILLDDPCRDVRQALARAVITDSRLPHHLALTLGHDDDAVAAIIVGGSKQLLEGELVDLVAAGGPAVQKAAAERDTVSPGLAAAIAEVGGADAVVELLLNTGARMAEFSLLRVLDRLGDEPFIRRAMATRDDLTIAVRQMLVRLEAADTYGVTITAAAAGDAPAEIGAREAAEKDTVDLAAAASDAELVALVDYLKVTAQLTTALILRAAVTGDMRFTGQALSSLTDVAAERAFSILERGDEAVVRALALKAGLPERAIPALYAAIEVARELAAEPDVEPSYGHVRRTVERIVARYRDSRDDELDDLVATLRRYAGEAARDAARRYVARAVQAPPLALTGPDVAEVELAGEPDLAAAFAAAYAPSFGDGFDGLGAAFEEAEWSEVADTAPVADEPEPAAEPLAELPPERLAERLIDPDSLVAASKPEATATDATETTGTVADAPEATTVATAAPAAEPATETKPAADAVARAA
jgi:uncharacterized protein (DUF2336 family)